MMGGPYEPPPDDSPIDPNPAEPYPGPPSQHPYPPPPYGAPYPPPPYGYPGYPGSYRPPWDAGRPNAILVASVLAYVNAGLLILSGLLLLAGASAVDSWNDAFGSHHNNIGTELAIDGLINLLSAALQIAGGILVLGRSERGRILLTVGGALCIAAGVYWLIRVHDVGVGTWTVLYVAMPITGLALVWTAPCTEWLRGNDPHQVPPPQ
jgi:hypothetical protein